MLNGPAFTDRTGHEQTTFPKFPRFAMAGPTATARLAQMTAVGCAAITVSDNRTICVQFLEGYAPSNFFFFVRYCHSVVSRLCFCTG